MGFKSNWSLIFERPNRRERERRGEKRRRRRRRREEEEEKREKQAKIKGMELTLGMNSCMNFHTIAWLLIVPKPRVC